VGKLRIGVDNMSLTKCNVPTDVIGSLGTTVEERGISTQQFKDKFDEMPEGIKTYLNDILTVELDSSLASKETPAGAQAKADTVNNNLALHIGENFSYVTVASRTANSAGTQSIPLGFEPKLVRIRAMFTGTNFINYDSDGSFDGARHSCILRFGNGTLAPVTDGTYIIYIHDGNTTYNRATCTFTPTGIDLTWTVSGTLPTGNIIMKIEAITH
jgi:hypothetical protein